MNEISAKICRCCLLSAATFKNMMTAVISTTSPKLLDSKMLDFFLIFSGISGGKLTTAKICATCETKLSEAFEFREMILQSDISLSQDLLSAIKEEQPEIKTEPFQSILVPTTVYLPPKVENENDPSPKKRKPRTTAEARDTPKRMPQRMNTNPEQTVCSVCNKKFDTEYKMKSHLYNNHKELKFQCEQCGKRFADKQRLTVHKFTHSQVRSVKCSLCPSDRGFFKDKRFLRAHYVLCHNIDRNCYKCASCPYSTKNKQTLKVHIFRSHYPHMLKFPCQLCNKMYAVRSQLSLHTQRTHRGERPFKCDVCPKSYLTVTVLRQHKNVVHNNVRFECKFCDKAYNSTAGLLEHLFSHREDKPYNCPECQNAYISRTNFKNHLRKCHSIIYDTKVHSFKGSFPDILKEGMKEQGAKD